MSRCNVFYLPVCCFDLCHQVRDCVSDVSELLLLSCFVFAIFSKPLAQRLFVVTIPSVNTFFQCCDFFDTPLLPKVVELRREKNAKFRPLQVLKRQPISSTNGTSNSTSTTRLIIQNILCHPPTACSAWADDDGVMRSLMLRTMIDGYPTIHPKPLHATTTPPLLQFLTTFKCPVSRFSSLCNVRFR